MLREFMKLREIIFPAFFEFIQYHWHISYNRQFVYPSVAKRLFNMIGAHEKIAIDVGANYGLATRFLSQYFKEVHAIEPIPFLLPRFHRIAKRYGRSESAITIHPCAVGAVDARTVMRIPVNQNGRLFHALSTAEPSNALGLFKHACVVALDVPQARLDTLLTETCGPVGYIKIDVEGFELDVLNGATQLIARHRPIIQMEIERMHNARCREAFMFLESYDYVSYSIHPTHLVDNAAAALMAQNAVSDLPENGKVDHQYDFLFVPRELRGAFADLIVNEPVSVAP
jgi:FkbM family methyltransferase